MGRGYIINWSEIENMDDEKQDSFFSSDYSHWICSYVDDSPIFFGILAVDIDCNETGYYKLNADDSEFSSDEMADMIKEFKTFFPNRNSYCPHNYIMGCVN